MSDRRMFSKTVTESDEFLNMPPSAQALYFHIGMNTDDDGYCGKLVVMRLSLGCQADLQRLQDDRFIYLFDDKVLLDLFFDENNVIRKDRKKDSKYTELYPPSTICQPDVNQMSAQVKLSKVKLSKEKHCRVAKEKKGELENLIDEVINLWKELSGQSKLSIKTEEYRKQIRGRIEKLAKERDIKEHDQIIRAFRYVFTNKGKQANDDECRRFSLPDWNLTTLTRPIHFNTYLDEPKHGTARSTSKPADQDAKKKQAWTDRLPPYIDTPKEYLNREQFAELYFKTPKDKRGPLDEMIRKQRGLETERGGNAQRAGELIEGIVK